MVLVRWVVLAVSLGFLVGCSSQRKGEAPSASYTVLQELNDLLRTAESTAGRPPTAVADLERHQSMYPRGYGAVKSGDVVVVWGAALKGESEVGKDEAVVAYEKSVPTGEGYVLLSAGTVKKMSAAEFKAAPKAGKS
jgi:hypothetical protein